MFVIVSEGATGILVRNRARVARLADLRPELGEAERIMHEATRQWYESEGDGSWPALAESTIARKASQGAADPARPLYFSGNLFESVTSPSGPWSFEHYPNDHEVVFGADWDVDGVQIPVVHQYGTDKIPARPIWPARSSPEHEEARAAIGEKLLRGGA